MCMRNGFESFHVGGDACGHDVLAHPNDTAALIVAESGVFVPMVFQQRAISTLRLGVL